ncbi:hypothetical protein AX16_002575 [Volvariella volvacea WC 439]|nr:hypothetical protein AX16_002575 [Volvariella volvacea WC 439]
MAIGTQNTPSGAEAGFPLNSDIIDRLVTFLPDLRSLFAFVLANGYVYQIFESRHHSILHAVARNQFGSVLPQALRAARSEARGLMNCDVNDLQGEDEVLHHDITMVEAGILARNAEVIDKLEDLYSWRMKDRTSKMSRLTSVESRRFKRAMYRIMLISLLYGLHSESKMKVEGRYFWSHPRLDTTTELSQHVLKQKEILLNYTSREVDEIRQAKAFLCKLALWALAVDEQHHQMTRCFGIEGVFLFAGPKFILENYLQCRSRLEVLDDYIGWPARGPWDGFLGNPTEDVLRERRRNQDPYIPQELPWAILDAVNGWHDTCEHCNSIEESYPGEKHAAKLWNETNWDFMRGYILLNLSTLIPGKLHTNKAEEDLPKVFFRENLTTIIREMFNCRGGAYENWRANQWFCVACLSSFIHNTLIGWWVWRKRQAGQLLARNCWYGYNCPHQEDHSHAYEYNHLCAPSMGNALHAGSSQESI